MKSQLINFLISAQNHDGGWGYFPGKHSALEPTAYVLMGLSREPGIAGILEMAARFIASTQTPQGGWPVSGTDMEPAAWVTPVVGFAILSDSGESMQSLAAVKFVLSAFGRMPKSWLSRIAERLEHGVASVSTDLGGWSWNPGTATWVEPTCYALLFLKKASHQIQDDSLIRIVAEAESMVYDRMCKRGGWNYGNAQVLGEELLPYPLTTALALIALQDKSSRPENQRSLTYLKQAVRSEKSVLGLSFASLCLDLYAQDWQGVWQQLCESYQETSFLKDIKAAALALIAFDARETNNIFQLKLEKA